MSENYGVDVVYASPDRGFADVENVLLHNVGSGSYRHLADSGLEVLRTTSSDALHHRHYRLATGSSPEVSAGEVMAAVSLDAIPAAHAEPGSWWAAIRDRLTTTGNEPGAEYTIEVWVRGPFVSMVKPMLDGLISALHVHDGSHEDHLRVALARYGEPGALWELLNDPATSILGRRTVVRPPRSRNGLEPR